MTKMLKKRSVLVVDDDPNLLRVINRELRKKYLVFLVSSGAAALRLTKERPVDLILLDLDMPKMNGYEVLKELRQNTSTEKTPVILMTDALQMDDGGELRDLHGFECGANDCIHIPFSLETLRNRVEKFLPPPAFEEIAQHIPPSVVRKGTSDLRYPNTYLSLDRTTGLLHREAFRDASKNHLRERPEGILVVFDMDGFRSINKHYGLAAGDDMIIRFARILRSTLPTSILLCRYGGDDFAAFFPGRTERETLKNILDQIMIRADDMFSKYNFELLEKRRGKMITLSIGIACAPEHATNYDNLLIYAEEALQMAKRTNRRCSQYAFFDPNEATVEKPQDYLSDDIRPQADLLKRRSDEKYQCWVKFGEYRILWNHALRMQKYHNVAVVSLFFSVVPKRAALGDHVEAIAGVMQAISDYFRDHRTPATFAHYSPNQFFMMIYASETTDNIVPQFLSDIHPILDTAECTIRYEVLSTTSQVEDMDPKSEER